MRGNGSCRSRSVRIWRPGSEPQPKKHGGCLELLLRSPVRVGRIATETADRSLLPVRQRPWVDPDIGPIRGEHLERLARDRDLPERCRMDLVGHQESSALEGAQVHYEGADVGCDALDQAVRVLHLGAGPRAAEIERDRRGERALAARGDERERVAVAGLEIRLVPLDGADIVHADVEAADVEARVAAVRGSEETRDLDAEHVVDAGTVDREARVRAAQSPCRPQRPRLERDAPLELAAAVGYRVAEREDAQAHGFGSVGTGASGQGASMLACPWRATNTSSRCTSCRERIRRTSRCCATSR